MKRPHRRKITVRIIRPGEKEPESEEWKKLTMAERMELTEGLSLICMMWGTNAKHPPRLQRSITRVQHARS